MMKFFKKDNMDEMLLQKQNTVAAKSFWFMFFLCIVVIIGTGFLYGDELQVLLPLYIVFLGGSAHYLYGTYKHYLPLKSELKPTTTALIYFLLAIAFGFAMGIRNVFFLYRDNMADKPMSEQILMVVSIAAIVAAGFLISVFGVTLLVRKFSKEQEKRIEAKILQENNEDE